MEPLVRSHRAGGDLGPEIIGLLAETVHEHLT